MNEAKTIIEETRKVITDMQVKLDWLDSTIDDIEKIIQSKGDK